jgi:hypothetical protein
MPLTRLRKVRLNELSLVDRPANQHAMVVLTKREEDATPANRFQELWKRMGIAVNIVKGALSFNEARGLEALYQAHEALRTSVRTILEEGGDNVRDRLTATLTEYRDAVAPSSVTKTDLEEVPDDLVPPAPAGAPDAEDTPGDPSDTDEELMKNTTTTEDVLKGITDPAQRALVEQLAKRAAEAETASETLTKRLESLEKAETERTALAKAEKAVAKSGVAPADAALIMGQLNEEGVTKFTAILAKFSAVAEKSNLFKEVGGEGEDAPADADDRLEQAAAALRKADPKLSVAASIRKALEQDESLYEGDADTDDTDEE